MDWIILLMAFIGGFLGTLLGQLLFSQKNRTIDLLPTIQKSERVDVAKVSRASTPSYRNRKLRESEGPEYRPGE